MHSSVALTVALALAAGVFSQSVARAIRVPAIILLLAVGVVLGPTGLGWVRPSELGDGLFVIVDFAVAIILFEGALNLDIRRLRREERAIRRLVTLGALVSLAGGALAARVWLDWPWRLAALFGALVVVTGPTVVGPLVRGLRLQPRLRTILEAEGVLIDPIGALLAVLVLQISLAADTPGIAAEASALGGRLLVGTGLGVAGGLTIAGLLRFPGLVHGLENILTLALVTLIFHLGESVLTQSGLLAITVAGLLVGNLKSPVDEDLREFKDQLTLLMIGAIFILLAADVQMSDVRALGWPGVGVVLTLLLVVRPLGAWLSTIGTGLSGRERFFVAAIAPRGIVAAAIASLSAEILSAVGVTGGEQLRALVFLVIAGTVFAAGSAAWPLSTLLGLRLPRRDRVAILGAQGLGLALGQELRGAGQMVVFVDADPRRTRAAEQEGFPVVFGDALSERTMRRLPVELVGTAVGVTYNDHLNSQFVLLATQTFGVTQGLVSVDSLERNRAPEHVARSGGDVLFEGAHDQERWDVRWRQREVSIEPFAWVGNGEARPAPPANGENEPPRAPRQEAFVILTLERGGVVKPMSLSVSPRKGDRMAAAIYSPVRQDALTQLAAAGWHPAPTDAEAAATAASTQAAEARTR